MSNKNIIFIVAGMIVIIGIVVIFVLRFSTSEDGWLCQDGRWIKHGNPKGNMPDTGCGAGNEKDANDAAKKDDAGNVGESATRTGNSSGNPENEEKKDVPVKTDLKDNDVVSSPLSLKGSAPGNWFFEGSFPIRVLDENGKEIAAGHAQAIGEWMTEGAVEFQAEIKFSKDSGTGWIVFQTDDPSGLPQNFHEMRTPVRFGKKSGISG